MDRAFVPPWKRLLERKSAEHFHRFHSTQPATFTRRGFLSTAAGAAGLVVASQFPLAPLAVAAETSAEPKPIPGGAVPFGILVHHNPLPAVSTVPLSTINDPSEIGDFNGLILDTMIRGGGAGAGTQNGSLAFRADMGAMQGEYIGEDGRHHHGSFVFIWLDIYTGPMGSANVLQQVHDYSPGIAANGLFWVISASHDAIQADLDNGFASLRMSNVPVSDAHDLLNNLTNGKGFSNPKIPPFAPVPATVSFDIEWSGISNSARIVNETQNFRGQFVQTGATINWSAEQAGFTFQSESPNPARNFYSVIGHEQNGVFFHADGND